MPDIVLKNITKKFGNITAVDDFSLTIPDGSFMCFLGPSGCGKTTILRMIAGLEEPTEGEIFMDGELVYSSDTAFSLKPSDRDVGLIFQSYALWPHMTVYENISFGLEMEKMNKQDRDKRIKEIAGWMGIGDLLDRYPAELSGGQQQRVALARSLAPQPSSLLMDEPLSNLDAKLRIDMRTELKRIHSETNQTIIYVTHDQLEALSLGTQVVVMNKGKLQQAEEPMELYRHPDNLFVAEFVGTPRINTIEGELVENHGVLGFKHADMFLPLERRKELTSGLRVVMAIRPEDLSIITSGEKGRYIFSIYSTLPAGADIFTRIRSKGIFLTVRQDQRIVIPQDSEVGVDFAPNSILIYDGETEELLATTSLLK